MQRGQLRQRQAGAGQHAHRPRVHSPELGALDDLVVHGKSRHLKRLQIPANRACADRKVSRELRNRLASRRGNPLQDRPLSNQLAVASHEVTPDVWIARILSILNENVAFFAVRSPRGLFIPRLPSPVIRAAYS